jgi:hypothetical protein
MAIIVVGGSNSGVGKTSLVCGLIAALPEFQWTAVKITAHSHKLSVANTPGTIQAGKLQADLSSSPNPNLTHAHRASFVRQLFDMRAEARADMRESAPAKGSIFEETVPGDDTDTARYLAAGAVRALVVSAPGGDLSDPLNQLWPRFGRGTNLIFESNSVIHHVRADACLLIHDVAERALPLPERKPPSATRTQWWPAARQTKSFLKGCVLRGRTRLPNCCLRARYSILRRWSGCRLTCGRGFCCASIQLRVPEQSRQSPRPIHASLNKQRMGHAQKLRVMFEVL